MPRYDLAGRTVLITGSTGGLGTPLARALRDRGAHLALLDLDGDLARRQAADLGPDTVARGWAADVRDLDSLRSATDAAAAHFGRLDVVVAGAGVGSMAPLETLDPEAWERVVDINLSGVWRTFRAALPHVKRHRGYLLAISSMAAFVHSPLNGPYVASKAGVWALCDATRLELRHEGVGVGSAHPTFFKTPMMDDVHADPAGTTLWGGNERGLWRMIPLDKVVDAVVTGIERRSPMIVAPRRLGLAARTPGLVRPLVDRIGFRGTTVPDAIARATPAGWTTRDR
ncbi:SDR family NAD(P)-dependent oxidoreductase [Streptomyces antibioticus]|uniref:SDR family NAD(P)-dependent oxidoreductase n=1 Tax=Streptomyces antibioticus TaxID=1890 RepID=A0AAE6YEU5_STRAT|nr:SDR family NAD(P)-dependent oxidoreductase [Streptomyces antibioticus]OOQ48036.1 short-chain dehydrogenase [Streptomyces antibioticus]QIT48388.1 SDR family NAD(P)-dependent oxidoreductase [Streptomyces antibioticus]